MSTTPRSPRIDDQTFCVLDTETTGFSPAKGDRITEVSLVVVDAFGNRQTQISTLVNPERDIPARVTEITRITNEMVADAPTFAEIAGLLCDFLVEGVVVAHNADFDREFIAAELAHLGVTKADLPSLCTMKLTDQLLLDRVPSRRLGVLAHRFGLPLDGAHAAYVDTRGTASLLAGYLEVARKRGIVELEQLRPSFLDGNVGIANTPTSHEFADRLVNRPGVETLLAESYPTKPAADRLAKLVPPSDQDEAAEWLARLERYTAQVSCPECNGVASMRRNRKQGNWFRGCNNFRGKGACGWSRDASDAEVAAAEALAVSPEFFTEQEIAETLAEREAVPA